MNSFESISCVPDCHGCTHGTCITPQVCQCNVGYNWDSTNVQCVPWCSGGCHNGDCIAPEKCACHEGYTHHATESVCIPHCNDSCVNGECFDTNQCECFTGYVFSNGSQHECEPMCELSCKNGKCIEPNVCECHSGFVVADDTKPHECHCGQYCVTIDEKCHCLNDYQRVSGYRLHIDDPSICTKANCLNGFCATPNDCECIEGFEKDDNLECIPVNETCIDEPMLCNSTAPEMCDCINGVCATNGTCVCLNGYKMTEKWTNRCEPLCSEECVS